MVSENNEPTIKDAANTTTGLAKVSAGQVPTIAEVQSTAKVAGKGIKVQLGCCAGLFFFAIFAGLFVLNLLNSSSSTDQASANTISGITSDTTSATVPSSLLNNVKNNKAVYEAAAARVGIPWQIIAALHCREASCSPTRSVLSGEKIGTTNPDNTSVVTSSLQDSANKAATHVVAMAKSVYSVKLGATNTASDIQKAFLAYNRGSMYKTGGCTVEQSPYVFNNFDSEHYHMKWPNSSCEPASTRGKVNIPNGAYTVYVYLINKGL